jgi:hypothetical protein
MTRAFATALIASAAVFLTIVGHAQVSGPSPTISGITGSMVQGATLTINGANLNAENRQNWDSRLSQYPNAWSFEGASPSADGITTTGTSGVYDGGVRLLGNRSIKFRSTITNPNCTTGIGQSYASIPISDLANRNEIWIRAYVRYNRLSADWPNNFIKMLEPLGSQYLFQPNGRQLAPNTNPRTWYMVHSGSPVPVNNPGGELQNNRWYAIELHFKASPRVYEAWIDGAKIYTGTPSMSGTWQLFLFGVINACGTESWDIELWVDGLAFGSQRVYPSALVEVGNSSSYSSATKKVQSIQSIDDDQITFSLDTSGLGSGPYYVWVRNNAQQLSPAYFLTGGQISGPVAPSNLRIVP